MGLTSGTCLCGYNDQNEWELPRTPGIWDLLESVQYKSAGVDQFIDDLMSDDDL